MRNALAIVRREVSAYVFSSLGYVIAFVMLVLVGFFFQYALWTSRDVGETTRVVFWLSEFVLMLISALITMRLLSEEARSGTLETLMTAPVTDAEVVLGKFFGALAFYVLLLAPMSVHIGLLFWLGKPDISRLVCGFLGLLLLGALFMSIGLFCSALTRHQILAAVLTIIGLLLLYVVGALPPNESGLLFDFMRYVGFTLHQENFTQGLIDSRDLVYYVSMIAFFLFLSVRALESRKWR